MYGPQIKHVVVTSSYAAIGTFDDQEGPSIITAEESLTSPFNDYFGSKKFAGMVACEFVEKENPNFTLSVINPVYVFGPQAFEIKNKSQTNHQIILNGLLNLKSTDTFTNWLSLIHI